MPGMVKIAKIIGGAGNDPDVRFSLSGAGLQGRKNQEYEQQDVARM